MRRTSSAPAKIRVYLGARVRALLLATPARAFAIDAVLGTTAVCMGVWSLWFPFGRDQGLFYYVGREWFERGAIPYRDVWDHKTPLIYVVHASAVAMFGEGMWPIRLVELLLMPCIGVLAATVATPPHERRLPGTMGVAWLMATLAYHGCLNFWDTAQCEVWCGALALASLGAVLRVRSDRYAAFWGGALAAVSAWFKPPAIFFAVVSVGLVARRAWRQSAGRGFLDAARGVMAFALGFAALSALVVGYFASYGAVDEMYDILVGANAYYVEHEQTEPAIQEALVRYTLANVYGPLLWVPVTVAVALCAWAVRPGRRALARRYGLFLALVSATAAGVFLQKKMYIYHWGSLVAALAYFGALAHRDLVLLWQGRDERFRRHVAASTACGLSALLLFAATPSSTAWNEKSADTIDYLRGEMSRDEFARSFDLAHMSYAYSQSEKVGAWLELHAGPEDTLAVRAFEPEIYATSGLHHTGRLFWTTFLTDTRRAYARERLRREDADVFASSPPDYVVALRRGYDEIDRCRWFRKRGYRQVHRVGRFCILEYENRPERPAGGGQKP